MKKVLILIATISAVSFTQANAQSRVSAGIKAEANASFFLVNDFADMKSDAGFGASLGAFMKIDLARNFAIQPELLFHFKSSEMKNVGVKNDYQYWGVEIPVYAVGQWKAGNGRFYLGVGPYGSFGFSGKLKSPEIDLYDKAGSGDLLMERWDLGAGLMIGYEFRFGLQINVGHKFSLLNALDNRPDDAFMRSQTVSLGLGFRF